MTALHDFGDTFARLMPGDACLVVCVGTHDGRKYHVERGEEITLGRSVSAKVPVMSDRVSRVHAKISRSELGDRAVLTAVGRNGTFVNGELVDGDCELRAGDLIRLDSTILKYLSGEDVNARYRRELHALFETDYLTGVTTHACFMEKSALEVKRSTDTGEHLALAVFEIADADKFQAEHGAEAYYRLLHDVAKLAAQPLESWEVVARFDLRRFALMLPDRRGSDAAYIARELSAAISAAHGVQTQFGVRALRRGESTSVEEMLHEASLCFEAAREQGKTVVVFSPSR